MFFSKRRALLLSLCIIILFLGTVPMAFCMSRPVNRLNILFITIDTLRPDHLGCYGYDKVKTPHIDRLAKDGILFSNAYSPVPLTLPSHVSMMTGQYPLQHGVRNNGNFVLADSAKTLAEILKQSGYRTGAVVSSFVLASYYGLNQGFDFYDDHFFGAKEETADYSENFRLGEGVTDAGKKWLQKNHQKPFFLWLHYFDPHAPYDPPSPFDTEYKESPYDGEIAYTDKCLGDFFEEMERFSLLENTCVIMVGDHGEGLWEHNEQTHGLFIYDTTLRVPFIISCPRLFPKGHQVDPMVRIIDIMPSILELLSIPSKGINLQGQSLMPLLSGKEKDISLNLFCETIYPKLNLNWAPLEGIVTADGWKYIHAPKPELYDLNKDPQEKVNLLSDYPRKVSLLKEECLSLKKELLEKSNSQEGSKKIALSPAERERLQSLGYIGFSGSADEETGDQSDLLLPDPKDKAHLLAKLDMARGLDEEGRHEEAIKIYEAVLQEDPENLMGLYAVGLIYKNMGRPEDSLKKISKLVEYDPQNFDAWNIVGLLYDMLGQPDKAAQAYKDSIRINPMIPYVHHNLGRVYMQLNELDLARREFLAMMEVSQDPVVLSMAYGNLGGIYAMQGKAEKALRRFKDAVQHDSHNHDAQVGLADTYYHLEDIDQSIEVWKNIIELWPDDYIACYRVAILLLEVERTDQAIGYLKRSLRIRPDYMDARMLLQQLYQFSSSAF